METSNMASMKGSSVNQTRRALFGGLAGLALSTVSLVIVWRGLDGGWPRSVEAWPLVTALFLAPVAWVLQGAAMWVLVWPQAPRAGLWRMVRLYLAAGFIGAVTPFGGAEIPYHLYVLRKLGLSTGMGTAVIGTKAALNVTVLIAGAAGCLVFSSVLPETGWRLPVTAGLVLFGVWAAIAYLLKPDKPRGGSARGGLRGWFERFSGEVREGFQLLWRREPRAVLACGALQAGYWGVMVSLGPLALMAAGWSGDSWAPVFASMLVLHAVLPFAPTPGGSGAAELGFAALMSPYVPGSALLGGVLLWRILSYYLPMVVGAFFLGRHAGSVNLSGGKKPDLTL